MTSKKKKFHFKHIFQLYFSKNIITYNDINNYMNMVIPKNYTIYHNSGDENLTDYLKNLYPEIYDSIEKEGYEIEYDNFDLFREIIYENEVAGFISLKIFKDKRFSIEECYVKAGCRSKNLLYNELLELASIPTVYLYARKPNYAFVKNA